MVLKRGRWQKARFSSLDVTCLFIYVCDMRRKTRKHGCGISSAAPSAARPPLQQKKRHYFQRFLTSH
jgi:hypothetical protein